MEKLVDVLKAHGYAVITTRDEMLKVGSGKVWGAFAPDAMAYDLDRAKTAPTEPSLAEMTGKAIELLAGSDKGRGRGFFLFVEGSKVDWAAHSNDPVGLVGDLLAFDEAVYKALEFAKKDGNTLVVVVADHGTGGLRIGTKEDKNYSQTDDNSVLIPMRRARVTGEGVEKLLAGDASETAIKDVLAREWGIKDLAAAGL
jgi:alkaline phosphatase